MRPAGGRLGRSATADSARTRWHPSPARRSWPPAGDWSGRCAGDPGRVRAVPGSMCTRCSTSCAGRRRRSATPATTPGSMWRSCERREDGMHDAVTAQWQLFDALEPDAYAALKASIREHGVLVPVEVDEHGVILDGHHRVRAWSELRAEGVAVPDYPRMVRVGLDDAAKRRHVIMLNLYRRHLAAEQRARFIAELRADGLTLQAIAAAAGVDKETVRRDLRTSESTFATAKVERTVGKDGKARPTRYKPRAVPTTAIALDGRQQRKAQDAASAGAFDGLPLGAMVGVDHPTVHAGARRTRGKRAAERAQAAVAPVAVSARLAVADALRLPLTDDAVDLIVTSPPYGLDKAYSSGDLAADVWPAFMADWLAEALRVTKPGGRLALNIPLDTFRPGCRPTYAEAIRAAVDAGWSYRSTIVWADNERGKSTARGSVDSPSSPYIYASAEMIGLFSKGAWAVEPRGAADIGHDDWLAWTDGVWRTRGEVSPWEQHPAPFPVEIARRLVLLLSYPGDVVLDPFVGSGTTAVAALRLGREPVGFDISQAYIASSARRIAADAERSLRETLTEERPHPDVPADASRG